MLFGGLQFLWHALKLLVLQASLPFPSKSFDLKLTLNPIQTCSNIILYLYSRLALGSQHNESYQSLGLKGFYSTAKNA